MKKGYALIIAFLSVTFSSAYSAEGVVCYAPKKSSIILPPQKNSKAHDNHAENIKSDVNENANSQITQLVIQYPTSNCENNKDAAEGKNETNDEFGRFLLDLIVKLISNVAWPLAIFLALIKFKKEVSHLMSRIKKVSVAGSEVEMSDLPEVALDEQLENVSPEQQVKATLDPRGSIISAWLNLEAEIYKLYQFYNLDKGVSPNGSPRRAHVSPSRMVNDLIRIGALSTEDTALIKDLMAIRNRVAHEIDFEVSEDDVVKYISFANDIESSLKNRAASSYRF